MPWLSPVPAPGAALALMVAIAGLIFIAGLLLGVVLRGGDRPGTGYQAEHQPPVVRPPVGGSGESGRAAR